jgi:hypothetical protein
LPAAGLTGNFEGTKTAVMHLDINDNTRLSEIQEVFANFYPYLRIRFFREGHKRYESSPETEELDPQQTIGELKQTHTSGLLEMQPSSTIASVENEFLRRFSLSVQIYQKQGENWLQTTGVDSFTLKEANELGRNSEDEFILEEE